MWLMTSPEESDCTDRIGPRSRSTPSCTAAGTRYSPNHLFTLYAVFLFLKLNQKFSCQGPLTCFRSFQSHLMVLEVQFSLSWVLTSIPFLLTMHHIFILFFLPFTSNPTLHLRWWCRSLRVGHLSQSYWRKSENWQKIRINSYIADFQTTLLLWMYRLCFAIVNNYFFIKTFPEMLLLL